MTGETKADVSGWTVDTLHAHTQRQINDLRAALDERYATQTKALDERYATQTKALDAAFAAASQAVAAALLAAEKAVGKAEVAAEKRFDCVAADTPVLCADLIWRPAGELLVGDELIAFDERPPSRPGRRFRRATVTANSVVRDALLLVTTPQGTVRCNAHHPWLIRRRGHESRWQWMPAENLRPGDELARPLDVWQYDRSWESGWLAGMYDGEGCLSMGKGRVQLSVTQRESPTSDLLSSVLKERLGKEPLTYRLLAGKGKRTQPLFTFLVTSRPNVLKILGSTRSPRLLARVDEVWEGKVIASNKAWTTVSSVESAGTGLIAQLSTSTATYIAAGFAMHNSTNEFRGQLSDQAATLMPRLESEAWHQRTIERVHDLEAKLAGSVTRPEYDGILNRIADLSSRVDRGEGTNTGADDAAKKIRSTINTAATIVTVILTVVAIAASAYFGVHP